MSDAKSEVTSETYRPAGGEAPPRGIRHAEFMRHLEHGRQHKATTQVRNLDTFRTQRENGLTSRGHGSKR